MLGNFQTVNDEILLISGAKCKIKINITKTNPITVKVIGNKTLFFFSV